VTTDLRPVLKLVRDVPKGRIASYGMIADFLPGINARMVGRALAELDEGSTVPWHRIVQAEGTIADRPSAEEQRIRLVCEGVTFKQNGAADWKTSRWEGPSPAWIKKSGADMERVMLTVANWRRGRCGR
jgi:methylated-DNA-protein-cysteine methyltransferase related protein